MTPFSHYFTFAVSALAYEQSCSDGAEMVLIGLTPTVGRFYECVPHFSG